MQIPNSLQDVWKKVSNDKSISLDDYKQLVNAAVPNGEDSELDTNEATFLKTLKSDLVEKNDVTKGPVPLNKLSFSTESAGAENAVQAEPPVKTEAPVQATAPVQETSEEAPQYDAAASGPAIQQSEEKLSAPQEGYGFNKSPITFPLPQADLPKAPVLLDWTGYNKQVNNAFSSAFGEKPAPSGVNPFLPKAKAEPILDAFGMGTVKQFQQMTGAIKQDNKFGPETFYSAKTYMATQINKTENIEGLTKLQSQINYLGNDGEIDKMKAALSERIDSVQNYLQNRTAIEGYFKNINNILGNANPKDMPSLKNAKAGLESEFNKLGPKLQAIPQVQDANKEAMGRVNSAINTLQAELDEIEKQKQAELEKQQILKDKASLVGELNDVVKNAVTAGLTTGDIGKINEGKTQVGATMEKYPKVKDMDDMKAAKEQALKTLDDAGNKINTINNLIGKKDWTKDESELAVKLLGELPNGALKDKLSKAIDGHSEAAKLKEKNRSNLPTTREGLHDVIGNGFWNLENKDGTKGLFQLVAKQGLLDEAIVKMKVEDQTEAIKLLTKDVKFDKMSSGDQFNVAIARSIYQNLSQSANIDKEVKDKTLLYLKKEDAPKDFSNFNVDLKSYVNGMKFSIGSHRIGSEQEAALTMARGIINGEVSRAALGHLNRYELEDLTKFVQKKGSSGEKNVLLNTVAKAYNDGVAVNIDSLDKGDKAKVVKGVLDIDNVNESKVSDLLKKAGKKTTFELVRHENLSDKQLAIVGKHSDGDTMADEPDVGGKLLVGMIKNYNKQDQGSVVSIGDIRKYIDQVDSDWTEDDDTMRAALKGLGDGPGSDYAKFRELAPATLDKIWKVAD